MCGSSTAGDLLMFSMCFSKPTFLWIWIADSACPIVFLAAAVSFLNYGYRAIAANEYAGLVFECNTGIARCVRTGDEVLEQLDFADVNKWADFGVLVALVVGYRFLAYLALLYLAKPKSKI
eukprot:Opistho-2@23284